MGRNTKWVNNDKVIMYKSCEFLNKILFTEKKKIIEGFTRSILYKHTKKRGFKFTHTLLARLLEASM